jgi:hypothetical protein
VYDSSGTMEYSDTGGSDRFRPATTFVFKVFIGVVSDFVNIINIVMCKL